MPHVSVTINGRQYRMACDDGQEHHLARLAHDLDQRITKLRTSFGEIGDMRLTVMAALLMADELFESGQRMRRFEDEFRAMQDARVTAADRDVKMQTALANAFNSAAERIEKVVKALNQTGNGSDVPIG
jgi:cell division protein ZapA